MLLGSNRKQPQTMVCAPFDWRSGSSRHRPWRMMLSVTSLCTEIGRCDFSLFVWPSISRELEHRGAHDDRFSLWDVSMADDFQRGCRPRGRRKSDGLLDEPHDRMQESSFMKSTRRLIPRNFFSKRLLPDKYIFRRLQTLSW
jgi:hypothetical protein